MVLSPIANGRPAERKEHLLQEIKGTADATGEIEWDVSVDSTTVRAQQYAAGTRTDPPACSGSPAFGT
ncbi:hypothetical protein AB0G29_35705 [Streptomyces parvus]|uniref:hypothetical protein n=1 Tax=Streptomyces TaxID=1883 RepID=UPI0033C3D082